MARAFIRVGTDVDIRGAFLEGRGVAVLREFSEAAEKLVSEAGEDQVRQRLGRRARHPTGSYARAVTTKDYAKGRTIIAEYPQVLYGPWLEGVSTRNASTRFKGYRMYRQTRVWLRKNLSEILQDLFDDAVAKLNEGGGP